MSLAYERGVLKHSKSKGPTRFVLLILAHHANEDGIAWPLIETIVEEMAGSRTAVNRAIKSLKRLQEIEVSKRGHGTSAIYKILLPPVHTSANKRADNGTLDQTNVPNSDNKRAENEMLEKSLRADNGTLDQTNVPNSDNKRAEFGTQNYHELPFKDELQQHGVDGVFDFYAPELQECFRLYCNNIGVVNQIVKSDLEDVYNGLSPPPDETKLEWFKYAILTASGNRKHTWNYVKGVISKIKSNGSLFRHKELWDGHHKGKSETNGVARSEQEQTKHSEGSHNGRPGESYAEAYSRVNDENIASFTRKYSN